MEVERNSIRQVVVAQQTAPSMAAMKVEQCVVSLMAPQIAVAVAVELCPPQKWLAVSPPWATLETSQCHSHNPHNPQKSAEVLSRLPHIMAGLSLFLTKL